MAISESEYSCYLRIVERLTKANPKPGSRAHERLEFYSIKCRWYEWERQRHPAGTAPPEAARYYELLNRVLTPTPAVLDEVKTPPPGRPR